MRALSLLAVSLWLSLMVASSHASATVITGMPDNSFIFYDYAGSVATYPADVTYRNYADSFVSDELHLTGYVGGAINLAVGASLTEGILRAGASASSGETIEPFHVIYGNTAIVSLLVGDRFYIDQEITTPIDVVVRLAGDGVASAPAGNVETKAFINAFTDPFGDAGSGAFVSNDTGGIDFLIEDTVTLYPGDEWFDVQLALFLRLVSSSLSVDVFTSLDFMHTALFDINLPDGFTFHSEGGFTGRAAAVPEPAALALLGTGLIGLAVMRRRRRI